MYHLSSPKLPGIIFILIAGSDGSAGAIELIDEATRRVQSDWNQSDLLSDPLSQTDVYDNYWLGQLEHNAIPSFDNHTGEFDVLGNEEEFFFEYWMDELSL